MRIRFPFAVAFLVLLLLSSSLGLLPHSALPAGPSYVPPQSDKVVHFLSFFALTATFYFILDTSRRRVLHLTLVVCTLVLGVGSEVLQGLLPNGRDFDPFDVLANVVGSLCAVGLAGWYHRRSADRKRRAKYAALTGEGLEGEGEDMELGLGPSTQNAALNGAIDGQETGVVSTAPRNLEEAVDNWDENAEDEWDDDDDLVPKTISTPATSTADSEDVPKKVALD